MVAHEEGNLKKSQASTLSTLPVAGAGGATQDKWEAHPFRSAETFPTAFHHTFAAYDGAVQDSTVKSEVGFSTSGHGARTKLLR